MNTSNELSASWLPSRVSYSLWCCALRKPILAYIARVYTRCVLYTQTCDVLRVRIAIVKNQAFGRCMLELSILFGGKGNVD